MPTQPAPALLKILLASQLESAARLAYLAARRAEYEYTARLSSSNFRISDIYKARNAILDLNGGASGNFDTSRPVATWPRFIFDTAPDCQHDNLPAAD